jgi:hypothetical protein
MESLAHIASRHYDPLDEAKKPPHYFPLCERVFGDLRKKPIRVLELGVHKGCSMFLWRDYFGKAIIVGLDIGEKPENFPQDARIKFVRGDQSSERDLEDATRYVAEQQFDIIIDDASHRGQQSKVSFLHLFQNHLRPGGWYAIEDFGATMKPGLWDGTPFLPHVDSENLLESHQYEQVGFVKQLIDHLLMQYHVSDGTFLPIAEIQLFSHLVFIRKAGGQETPANLWSRWLCRLRRREPR